MTKFMTNLTDAKSLFKDIRQNLTNIGYAINMQ